MFSKKLCGFLIHWKFDQSEKTALWEPGSRVKLFVDDIYVQWPRGACRDYRWYNRTSVLWWTASRWFVAAVFRSRHYRRALCSNSLARKSIFRDNVQWPGHTRSCCRQTKRPAHGSCVNIPPLLQWGSPRFLVIRISPWSMCVYIFRWFSATAVISWGVDFFATPSESLCSWNFNVRFITIVGAD